MLTAWNLNPTDRELRQFGVVAFLAFGLLGAVVLRKGALLGVEFGTASAGIAAALLIVGSLSLGFALARPKANRPLYVLLTVVSYPVGWIVSHLMLALLFFGFFTPIALLFRAVGRDTLERSRDRERESYWVDLPPVEDDRRYFRQF
jgi:hypothetical protein